MIFFLNYEFGKLQDNNTYFFDMHAFELKKLFVSLICQITGQSDYFQ